MSKLRVAYILPSSGKTFHPFLLRDPSSELHVHPREGCLDIDYLVLEKEDYLVFLVYNFEAKVSTKIME